MGLVVDPDTQTLSWHLAPSSIQSLNENLFNHQSYLLGVLLQINLHLSLVRHITVLLASSIEQLCNLVCFANTIGRSTLIPGLLTSIIILSVLF